MSSFILLVYTNNSLTHFFDLTEFSGFCRDWFWLQITFRVWVRFSPVLVGPFTTLTCLPHMVEASHYPFNCWTSSREVMNTIFCLWSDLTRNQTIVHYLSYTDTLSARPLVSLWKRYCSKSVLLKWGLLEVIKKCHKPFSTIPLEFVKIRFNPFDFVPVATLHFAILSHHKRLILKNFLQTSGYCLL